MKRYHLICFTLFLTMAAGTLRAQPRPFPVDSSFHPSLAFLQMQWTGSFYGIDPMTQARFHLSRTLTLRQDATFTNRLVGGEAEDMQCNDTLLFRMEVGTYRYDSLTCTLTFVVEEDSALLLDAYVRKGETTYSCHDYTAAGATDANTYTEPAQFTYPTGGVRQWVVQDAKYGSDQQRGMPAVYVMDGAPLVVTAVDSRPSEEASGVPEPCYDLYSRRVEPSQLQPSTIVIIRGRKVLAKELMVY